MTTPSGWYILASALMAMVSGLPHALMGRRGNAGQVLSCLMLLVANLLGGLAVWRWWVDGPGDPLSWPSPLPGIHFSLFLDGISAIFLLPIFVITSLASIYGLQYWRHSEYPESAQRVSFFLGWMTGGMTLLVAAQDGLLFLTGWELMAVAGLFLVSAEDHLAETRKAAWLYIGVSHFATLCLFGMFALLYAINGSFDFEPIKNGHPSLANWLALLALLGFGTKAGIMPLHVWLPGAHAQSPSHVSSVMSGVLIKMGVYGLVRMSGLFPEVPVAWGLILLVLGCTSGVLGVVFAISQHDIKRLLAYHSIENIGIIVMGLGLALLGRAQHREDWIMLGMAGAMLHVWNHALFKSLLFFAAGSVVHATRTREIDQLGGLLTRMPATAFFFLIGAVAICGLPPLNGFVSELFIYLGLFRTLAVEKTISVAAAAFAAPVLALIGALAVACFVKVFGTVFLGAARESPAREGHEAGLAMTGPMGLLAACCVLIGLAPWTVTPLLQRGIETWAGKPTNLRLQELAPLGWVSIAALVLLVLVAVIAALLQWRLRAGGMQRSLTWDCGYAAPSARMQYTSSSFAQMLVALFRWALWPVEKVPRVRALFPAQAQFLTHTPDPVLERILWPVARALYRLFYLFRYLQQGNIQAYLLYMLAILVLLLVWH